MARRVRRSRLTDSLTLRGRSFLAAGLALVACGVVIGFPDITRLGVLVAGLPLLVLLVILPFASNFLIRIYAWIIGRSRLRTCRHRYRQRRPGAQLADLRGLRRWLVGEQAVEIFVLIV